MVLGYMGRLDFLMFSLKREERERERERERESERVRMSCNTERAHRRGRRGAGVRGFRC